MAILLASSTLIAFHPISSMAQAPISSVTAQDIEFSIPAQSLASAIKLFIRITGWQVGYPSALVDGLQSRPVSGRLSPQAALATMLAGTGVSVQVTGPETATLVGGGSESGSAEEDGFVLNPIIVKGVTKGVRLGSDSVADTGTTTISGGQIEARSIGNDANDILRDMPNVQYQNDIDDDAGITDQSVIDLKPREVRISGARVYENNFILDGMPINTLTGTAESANKELEDSYTPPIRIRSSAFIRSPSTCPRISSRARPSSTAMLRRATAISRAASFPTNCARRPTIAGTAASPPTSPRATGRATISERRTGSIRTTSSARTI
ncbi:TonB-dependent receptor plug domain-containing protein (plasmid) [Rhizobium sp. BG6]|nr:TonB-dependent receptor plug domain-containing protein [Rhizobium sp. BG6]